MRTVRIKKVKELKEKDFYQTHPSMVYSLINNYDIKGTILDPCAGKGIIGSIISVDEFDLHPGKSNMQQRNFLNFYTHYDNIIMNPPYSDKYRFIDHALAVADRIFVLLPLDTSNYNIFHTRYLNTNLYRGRLLMTPKIMLSETIKLKRGGNTSYAWYEFGESKSKVKYEKYDDLMRYIND